MQNLAATSIFIDEIQNPNILAYALEKK